MSDPRDAPPPSTRAGRAYLRTEVTTAGDDSITQPPPPASTPTLSSPSLANDDAFAEREESDAAFGVPLGFGASAIAHRAFLVVNDGGGHHVLVELRDGESTSFGRSSVSDVVVDDPRVSRHHAIITRRGSRVAVRDQESRNGTKVNGAILRSAERILGSGDTIRVGCAEIVVGSSAAPCDARDASNERAPSVAGVVVADRKMREVFTLARQLGRGDGNLLVQGETGVGKKLVASQVHRASARAGDPLVQIDCRQLADEAARRAFGGPLARDGREDDVRASGLAGALEQANGGTLLLVHVDALPREGQAALYDALTTRTLAQARHDGPDERTPLDVRVIATTERDLPAEAASKRFDPHLYYALAAFTIRLPPLRERPSDVQVLTQLVAQETAASLGRPAPSFEPDAEAQVLRHDWLGNVRELRAVIREVVAGTEGRIGVRALPEPVQRARRTSERPTSDGVA